MNAILPGGVFNNQPKHLVENVKKRTLLGRWANENEYEDAIVFLASNSSSYMTGQSIICLLYTSPSPRDKRQSRMPSSA